MPYYYVRFDRNNMKSPSAYFYSIFATTLVLVVIGVVFMVAIEARNVSVSLKENLALEVVLNDETDSASINGIKAQIEKKAFVKKAVFISKEQAAEMLKKELGDNYLEVLGYNPLYPSFRINLNEAYANQKSFERIQKELASLPNVQEVNIQKTVMNELDKSLRNFTYIGLIMGAIFLAFAVSLIFSAIKLDIFGRRQVIKSMQLFGATRWFIVRPYLARSILNGLVSGILASAVLYSLSYYLDYEFPALGLTADLLIFAELLGLLIVFGIIISFFSTLIALARYLNYKLDDFN